MASYFGGIQPIIQTPSRYNQNNNGKKDGESCGNLFREFKILPLKAQYILSLLLFVTKNKSYL
jgi:hypothetical protein